MTRAIVVLGLLAMTGCQAAPQNQVYGQDTGRRPGNSLIALSRGLNGGGDTYRPSAPQVSNCQVVDYGLGNYQTICR